MRLILGIGVVGRAAVEYFRHENLCFYDEVIKEYTDSHGTPIPFFVSWDLVDSVVVSPGFSDTHPMIVEANSRGIPLETDVEVFLKNCDPSGVKIAVTGTNGKSTLCALLKYILGDLAEIGGNFGTSPLLFKKNNFYIIELSSYQLFWLSDKLLQNLDIGIITNIGNHHLTFHKTKGEYIRVKKKILQAKHVVHNMRIDEKVKYPKNVLFEQDQYKLSWQIILKVLDILNLDEKRAAYKLESYIPLKYRQEIISELPLVINDSKSTNIESMACALGNMRKRFVLISQVSNYEHESFSIYRYPLLRKIFILSNKEVENLRIPYYVSNNFEYVVEEAFNYAADNNLGILFSPGEQSFEFFKNFESRGEIFSNLIQTLLKKRG